MSNSGFNYKFMSSSADSSNTVNASSVRLDTQTWLSTVLSNSDTDAQTAFSTLNTASTGYRDYLADHFAFGVSSITMDTSNASRSIGTACINIGNNATLGNWTGADTTLIGKDNMNALSTGVDNTCVGRSNMKLNDTGYSNVSIGSWNGEAMKETAGIPPRFNVLVGYGVALDATNMQKGICLGYLSGDKLTTAIDAIMIGTNTTGHPTYENQTAIGFSAETGEIGAICMGAYAKAMSRDSIAIGSGNQVDYGAFCSSYSGISIGYNSSATVGDYGIAIGSSASIAHSNAISIGTSATSFGVDAVSIGRDSECGSLSVALGSLSGSSLYSDITCVGYNAKATGNYATSLGSNTSAGVSATALGYDSTASALNTVAIGNTATATNDHAISIGLSAASAGTNAVSIGRQATCGGESVAIGSESGGNFGGITCVGHSTTPTSNFSTIIGYGAGAGDIGTAIGHAAQASGTHAIAIGYSADATGASSIAMGGFDALASATGAIAIGNGSRATGANGISIGNVDAGAGETRLGYSGNTKVYVYNLGNTAISGARTVYWDPTTKELYAV